MGSQMSRTDSPTIVALALPTLLRCCVPITYSVILILLKAVPDGNSPSAEECPDATTVGALREFHRGALALTRERSFYKHRRRPMGRGP